MKWVSAGADTHFTYRCCYRRLLRREWKRGGCALDRYTDTGLGQNTSLYARSGYSTDRHRYPFFPPPSAALAAVASLLVEVSCCHGAATFDYFFNVVQNDCGLLRHGHSKGLDTVLGVKLAYVLEILFFKDALPPLVTP